MKIVEIVSANDENCKAFSELKNTLYNAREQIKLSSSGPFSHPYFYKAFVAFDDDKFAAHAVLYDNPFLFYNGFKTLCLGNYECIENEAVSKALLAHLIYETKQVGAHYLIGPMNGSSWDNYRFCDNSGNGDFFLEPYNKTYYNHQFSAAGFTKIASYFSSVDDELNYQNEALQNRETELNKGGLVTRQIDIGNYENELKNVYNLCLEAFADNFLYTPISEENFIAKYFSALPYMDKNFVLMAEDEDGLAGFIFCLPNILNADKKQLILKTVARKKARKYRGLGDILAHKISSAAKESGYTSIIHALMYSGNASFSLSKKHSGKVFKTYSLYAAETGK